MLKDFEEEFSRPLMFNQEIATDRHLDSPMKGDSDMDCPYFPEPTPNPYSGSNIDDFEV